MARLHRIIKRCACGSSYTSRAWHLLPWLGDFADTEEAIEMRLCQVCGSTCAITIRQLKFAWAFPKPIFK